MYLSVPKTLTDTFFCANNRGNTGKLEVKINMSKKIFMIISVILTLALCFNISSLTANAEVVAEVVTQATSTSKSLNTSQTSTNSVTFGYSVTMKASSKGLDTKKCQYAFFYKYEDDGWTTIQPYGKNAVVEWTPEKMGRYEVCIKILCNGKVYKKYFNMIASEELVNLSVISSSHIKTGDSVTLNAKAEGGLAGYTFAYYCKNVNTDWWTILNDYKEATSMQWKPSESGVYDICIKAKDDFGQVSEKYFTLTVENEGVKTPAEFSLELKAPISAPYQWSCDISDESVVKLREKKEYSEMSVHGASMILDYRFATAKAGVTDITMKYTAYNGKVYSMVYSLTVDKHLNYKVDKAEGNYFEDELPEIRQITQPFHISVQNDSEKYSWTCDISNANVIMLSDVEKGYSETYRFNALRKGFATIVLSCVSSSNMDILYQLVYDVSVDDDLKISVDSYDGYYIEDYWLPEIEF